MTPASSSVLHTLPQAAGKLALPASYNYVGAFLTFRCPYQCSYCINRFHGKAVLGYQETPGSEWIRFFEQLDARDVPVTLQGGEPGLHPDFRTIVREVSAFQFVDILTNLAFDLRAFVREISPEMINREAPYAPIRASYHPEQFSLKTIVERVLFLQKEGFRVGLYGVQHPEQMKEVEYAAARCADLGIDFRTKPFLGWHEGKLHGAFAHPEACAGGRPRRCECAPSELLIAPDGAIHRCHQFLYEKAHPLGHISDTSPCMTETHLACDQFGRCNPCDVKVKNNRFQQFGHVAARIRNIEA
jgi:hypothetical protein